MVRKACDWEIAAAEVKGEFSVKAACFRQSQLTVVYLYCKYWFDVLQYGNNANNVVEALRRRKRKMENI